MLTFYEQGSLPSSSTQPAPAAHGGAQAPVTVPALVVACKFPAPAGGGSRVFVLVLHSGHLHVAGAGRPSCGEPGRPVRLVQTDMAASHGRHGEHVTRTLLLWSAGAGTVPLPARGGEPVIPS